MKIQVLVAAMNQQDHSLLERMNIQSDAIIGNQCKKNSIENFSWNGHNITYLNFNEKGVGLNRNNALMRAKGDICLFADDDMIYEDGYVALVEKTFQLYSDADVIIFNIHERIPQRYIIKKVQKVKWYNYLRYGTVRIAIRLRSIKFNAIYFNLCFGGGSEFCHGEDSLFLSSCIKNGLNIYAVPDYIALLDESRKSTWNRISIERYLLDQGVLYRAISSKWWRLLCLQDSIRHRKKYGLPLWRSYNIMIKEKDI